MADRYISALDVTGTGTEGQPFGVNQLVTGGKPGLALANMTAGDTIYLDGDSGTFDLTGLSIASFSYAYALIVPSATDCTVRSKPGTKAVVRLMGGLSPLVGTLRDSGFVAHRTRIIGIECVEVAGKIGSIIDIRGTDADPVQDCEVGYCRTIGTSIESGDNHEGILFTCALRGRAHHNECRAFVSVAQNYNSVGIKEYRSDDVLFDLNYVHANNAGIFLKDHGVGTVVRQNLAITNVMPNGTKKDLISTIQNGCSDQSWYDNISDSRLFTDTNAVGVTFRNNLIRDDTAIVFHQRRASSPPTTNTSYDLSIHSNILLSTTNAATPYYSPNTAYTATPADLTELDYNLVVSNAGGTPMLTYPWYDGTKSLATVQGLGWEVHTQAITGGPAAIYDDPDDPSTLKSAYLTAGKDGGKPGPADPATVLDLPNNVGPEALIALEGGGGSDPATELDFSGPLTGMVGVATAAYYLIPDGTFTGTATPSDDGAGGTFTPASVTWSGDSSYRTFTYTPAVSGDVEISVSNDGGLPDPDPLPLSVGEVLVVRAFPTSFIVLRNT